MTCIMVFSFFSVEIAWVKWLKWLVFPAALLLLSGLLTVGSCKNDKGEEKPSDVWDVDNTPLPRFASNYIGLGSIYRISRFRSAIGHDYSDFTEHCRSMKHYFQPADTANWSAVKVFAPVAGNLTRVEQEWSGVKLEIQADAYPAFRFVIFHISPLRAFSPGDHVAEGEWLGTHIGSSTMSDIAVIANDPTRQGRMVSYFDVLSDAAFAAFQARGITSRSQFIISKAQRDLFPLQCLNDEFISADTIANWVYLK